MTFAATLHDRILVLDGPMGTELYRRHVFTNRCFEELNLTDPKLIRQILTEYRDAGADVLTTNTFGANRYALQKYGLGEQTRAINVAGAAIARQVADSLAATEKTGHFDGVPSPFPAAKTNTNNTGTVSCFVAGSIGPIPTNLGSTEPVADWILEQVDALMEGGADFILFETQPSRESMEFAATVMAARPNVPFVLSCAIVHGKETVAGEPVSRLFAPLPSSCAQPVAWGFNCGNGPDGLLEAIEDALPRITIPLIVQPNAGLPKEFEGRHLYYCSPEYVATYSKRFVQMGVAAVGGCCGMTPEHIREIAKTVKPLSKDISPQRVLKDIQADVELVAASPFAERSRFAWKLAHKKWVQCVEMVPPRGYDLAPLVEKCKSLGRFGVDAINLPDGPRASSRIAPLVVAQRILRDAGVEPILHFCCRDRNLIGMQADLLACAASEIRNLLFVTGDPPKLGNYPQATGVFDTDSIGMAAVQQRLNQGVDLGGQSISPPTHAVIGVGLDPTALDLKRELDRFHLKIAAGAEFAITQPVFDPSAILSLLETLGSGSGTPPIPILAGIWPLTSYRNAQFMQNEVPGVVIPEATMARMEAVSDGTKEEQIAVGIEIARESIRAVADHVAGVQVSAPFGRIDIAMRVLE